MNVGSLFSGIGGFDYGLERAGMRVAWQCEADEFCRRVLTERWPDVPCYPDIRHVSSFLVEPVDVLCGGFPCQDISSAGRKVGIGGERSGLWGEYARLIGELRPRYVVVENVAALLTRGLGRVLGDLESLGYDAEWDCLPASAFGAPHQRDRLWLVAYPKSGSGTDEPRISDSQALLGTVAGAGGGDLHGDPAAGVRVAGRASAGITGDVADPERSGWSGRPQDAGRGPDLGKAQERSEGAAQLARRGASGGDSQLADADSATRTGARGAAETLSRPRTVERPRRRGSAGGNVQDADECAVQPWRIGGRAAQAGGSEWWAVEPPVGRVAHGVPDRLDQLAALGNALVPQIAEWLGRRILDYERSVTDAAA